MGRHSGCLAEANEWEQFLIPGTKCCTMSIWLYNVYLVVNSSYLVIIMKTLNIDVIKSEM